MSRLPDPHAKATLVRAAEEVFAEHGLAGSRVEAIARRAGVSKGAFYLHFASKEAAFLQVVESFLARCGSFARAPSAAEGADADALAEEWLRSDVATFAFLWRHRALVRILGSCHGAHAYLVEAFRDDMQAAAERRIAFWRAHGCFRDDVDVELVAALMCGGYHELVQRMLRATDEPDLEAWVRETQALFVRGAGTRTFCEAVHERNQRVTPSIGHGRAATARRTREGARP